VCDWLRADYARRFPRCAINDCNAIIAVMASITIRRLPEATNRRLRIRAARNGRSMEQEARGVSVTQTLLHFPVCQGAPACAVFFCSF
jgi:hypothetical protein